MGLAEILGARAARQGRSAPVECGELGTVTVEALPVRELELLLRGADGARAVFYAACRELQSAGEELRKAGKVFTPDGIMQFVSDGEAAAAARTVLELSGWTEKNHVDRLLDGERTKSGSAVNIISLPDENRLQIVQEKSDDEKAKTQVQTGANRLGSVQFVGAESSLEDEIRPGIVQEIRAPAPGFGQVSRETWTESAKLDLIPEADKKTQAKGILLPERTQNVVTEKNPSPIEGGLGEAPGDTLHEPESEFGDALHERTSEFQNLMHESKSDFGESRRGIPHESKSEFGDGLHETTSELRNGLHETASELAEAVARRLVEGLRRAKWVRGD